MRLTVSFVVAASAALAVAREFGGENVWDIYANEQEEHDGHVKQYGEHHARDAKDVPILSSIISAMKGSKHKSASNAGTDHPTKTHESDTRHPKETMWEESNGCVEHEPVEYGAYGAPHFARDAEAEAEPVFPHDHFEHWGHHGDHELHARDAEEDYDMDEDLHYRDDDYGDDLEVFRRNMAYHESGGNDYFDHGHKNVWARDADEDPKMTREYPFEEDNPLHSHQRGHLRRSDEEDGEPVEDYDDSDAYGPRYEGYDYDDYGDEEDSLSKRGMPKWDDIKQKLG